MSPEMKYETAEPVNLGPGESKAVRFISSIDGSEHMFMVSLSEIGEVTVITDDMSITADEYQFEES
jgi:hypothetical protein